MSLLCFRALAYSIIFGHFLAAQLINGHGLPPPRRFSDYYYFPLPLSILGFTLLRISMIICQSALRR